MKAPFWLLAAVALTFSTHAQVLTPSTTFTLSTHSKDIHNDRSARPYFMAGPNGLTLVVVSATGVSLTSADLSGNIRHSRSDIASVHASIYGALPRPDGSVWLLSAGPSKLAENYGGARFGVEMPMHGTTANPHYQQLDLYSPDGEEVGSLRLLANSRTAVAAGNNQLVLRSGAAAGFKSDSQIFHFGSVEGDRFKEQTQIRLAPPVLGAIAMLAEDGVLLLIDKKSGNMMVIDPQAKAGRVAQLSTPRPVRAAAVDGAFVYLFAEDSILKADRAGQILATYSVRLGQGFEPAAIGVTGNSAYLADKNSQIEQFQLN